MLRTYLSRGILAGAAGGLFYGLFVALVGSPLVAVAESYETAEGAAAVGLATAPVSVVAGVVWGVLLGGVVFGLGYYLVEPALPGRPDTSAYLLGAAGFVTVSGAPWLVLPPQPPGVEQALSTEIRLGWSLGMVVLGAAACGGAVVAYDRLRAAGRAVAVGGALVPLLALVVPVLLAPANPTSGPLPATLADAFRWTTVFGQVALWLVISLSYVWIADRLGPAGPTHTESVDPRPA